jgi:hypothetical protein
MPRFKIEVDSLTMNEEEGTFSASGSIRDLVAKSKTKPFTATTIMWQGSPIFKVDEAGALADKKFKRGERIAIARRLKLERLAKFGEQLAERAKPAVEVELEVGETVQLAAK